MLYIMHQATMPNATTHCSNYAVINSIYLSFERRTTEGNELSRFFLILDKSRSEFINKILSITKDAVSQSELVVCIDGDKISRTLSIDQKEARSTIEHLFDNIEKMHGAMLLPSPMPHNKLLQKSNGPTMMSYPTAKDVRLSIFVVGSQNYAVPIPLAKDRDSMAIVIEEAIKLFTINKKNCRLVVRVSQPVFSDYTYKYVEFLAGCEQTYRKEALNELVCDLEEKFGRLKF